VRALKAWQLKHTVTSAVQAAKGLQRQLRLRLLTTASIEQIEIPAKLLNYFVWSNKSNINQSGGTCMTACILHKSQKAISSLSRLTKKVNEHAVATSTVSKNLQRQREKSGGEGAGNKGDNTPAAESGRWTHLLYFTFLYCIRSHI